MKNSIKNDLEDFLNPLDKVIEKIKAEIKEIENNTENKPGKLLMLKTGLSEVQSANKIIYDVWENFMYLENTSDIEKLNFFSDVINLDREDDNDK